jgi:hypothetical protein
VNNRWSSILNLLILFSLLFFLAGLQGTFWFELFNDVPPPLLWLNLIVYITLYRKPLPAILIVYAMGFAMLSFTLMPLKMMWLSLLVLFTSISLFKQRVFWSGPIYYSIMCALSVIGYHAIFFLLSNIVEKNPVGFELVDRITQILLTPLFAMPMYWGLTRINKSLIQTLDHESGGIEI